MQSFRFVKLGLHASAQYSVDSERIAFHEWSVSDVSPQLYYGSSSVTMLPTMVNSPKTVEITCPKLKAYKLI